MLMVRGSNQASIDPEVAEIGKHIKILLGYQDWFC